MLQNMGVVVISFSSYDKIDSKIVSINNPGATYVCPYQSVIGDKNEQYKKRMCTVEPVFGQMKHRGFREFLLRGKRKNKIEFVMMCTVHNVKKIADFIKREGKSLKQFLYQYMIEVWNSAMVKSGKA